MPTRLLYLIGFTHRSGSQWLCNMLTYTYKAGIAHEHVNDMEANYPSLDDAWKTYVDKDLGIKLGIRQMKKLWHLVEAENPKVITLFRHDLWQAAVSVYRAQFSNVWVKSTPGHEMLGQIDDEGDIPFNADKIIEAHELLKREREEWSMWLDEHGVQPLSLWYEGLCQDPEGTARQVLTYLGIAYDGGFVHTTQKQRTPETEQWARDAEAIYGNNP